MVIPSDPYQFILSESVVSSSQEDILKRIPGWDDAKVNDSLTPSQPPLAASEEQDLLKLCCSARSDSDDVSSSQGDPDRSWFGVRGPLEWKSPDTEEEKVEDSYNAAFESNRSQSPGSPRTWNVPIVADLFTATFITQSQIGTENVLESQPSTKDMAQSLKTDEAPAEFQGTKTGESINDSLAKDDWSHDFSFRIRELGVASNSLVPADMKGPRDSDKIYSRRMHRKNTAVKKCPKPSQSEKPCHNLRSSKPSSPMETAERCTDVCAESKRNAGASADESDQVNRGGLKCEELISKTADVKELDMAIKSLEDRILDLKKLQDPVHVQKTSSEDLTKLKSTSTFCVSALERKRSGRKRTTEEEKFDSVASMLKTKALKHVSSDQEQTETSCDAISSQGLPAVIKKVASQRRFQEIKQSQVAQQLGETANNDSSKNISVQVSQLQQSARPAGPPEDLGPVRSKALSATEHIGTSRETEKIDRGESCVGHSGNNKQSANGKDLKTFPESVIDVVMLHSGCLPPCKPDDPDFLTLVIGSGVSLPLPFRRGKSHCH